MGFEPQHATIAKSAPEYLLAPELLALSDWERHALNFTVKGSYLGYGSTFFPSSPVWLNRPSLDARANGRIDIDRDDRIDAEGRFIISTDNPGSPNITAGNEYLPLVLNGGATLGYTHLFDRFEITAKGQFDRFTWQKSFLTDGTYVSNGDRNYDQIGGSLRGSYEVLPGVKPYVEAYSDERVHDITLDSTGAMRDSDGQIYKVGTTFVFSPKLTGEIAVGRTQRSYRDPTLANVNGPLVDGSVLFLPNPLTTIKFNAVTTTGELVVVGASGVLHRDYTLEVDHDFRRWLTGIMKLGYGVDYYVGMNRTDNRYFISPSLTYKFTRDIWLRAEFRHDWLSSSLYGNFIRRTCSCCRCACSGEGGRANSRHSGPRASANPGSILGVMAGAGFRGSPLRGAPERQRVTPPAAPSAPRGTPARCPRGRAHRRRWRRGSRSCCRNRSCGPGISARRTAASRRAGSSRR